MPRGAKKNANQHNNRHENGIVAPGKRIIKQKSNGHLNGSPDGRPRANTPPLPSPPSQSEPHVPDNVASAAAAFVKSGWDSTSEDLERKDGAEETEYTQNGQMSEPHHRKIDVNAAKNSSVHDGSAASLALTILKSCPLRDTLAILMVLLSLPPTFLTLTNTLFAMLTFVPPSGSFTTLPSLTEITQGSSGAPSFITICITDIIGILLWLVIFTPVQHLALELTQAVVATTLGGGYSSKNSGSDGTLLCMAVVTATHLSRYKELLLQVARHTWVEKWLPVLEASDNNPVLASTALASDWSVTRAVKTFIALHILIQGLSRMVRRWYFKREYAHAASKENVTGPQASADSYADQPSTPAIASTDSIAKSSLQSLRFAQAKESSGKKKRKQGNYVRSQQPLWAAFAATKVTVIREYEQSQATSEAAGSNATDVDNLGSAPFVQEEGRVWITLVKTTSFFFDTSAFPMSDAREQCDKEVEETGIDRSKPFYVRINGADWTSAKIMPLRDVNDDSSSGQQWTGEVYGLSPACTYQSSFIRSENDEVLYTTVITTPSPVTDQLSTSNPSQYQHLRPTSPASPITTLKTSIAAAESTLNESTAQQRRAKKDNKAAAAAIRKDIDAVQEKLNRLGATERNLQNRQIQQNQNMRQADDAITSICDELEVIAQAPEDDSIKWRQAKSAWEEQRAEYSSVRESLQELKESNQRDTSSIQGEALSAQQKRERLQHRIAKLSDQYERLQSATVQGLNEKERLFNEIYAKEAERLHVENQYKEQITSLTRSIQEYKYRSRQAMQQSQVLETAFEQQQLLAQAAYSQPPPSGSRPITPEGDLPGTFPFSAISPAFRFPTFSAFDPHAASNHHHVNGTTVPNPYSSPFVPAGSPFQLHSSPFQAYAHLASSGNNFIGNPLSAANNARTRSTSVLSGNSIYTDFSDQDPAPPMPTRASVLLEFQRKHSESSGSVSANGSQKTGGSSPLSPAPPLVGMVGEGVGTGWKGKSKRYSGSGGGQVFE
ncbi:MAG: hypothetical protein MMC33_005203 [Icmadophila ericetorum]|nr:hypothetical protein [Icmadophila ericetorum]